MVRNTRCKSVERVFDHLEPPAQRRRRLGPQPAGVDEHQPVAVNPQLRPVECAQIAVVHRHVEAQRRVARPPRQHHDGVDRAAKSVVVGALNLLGLAEQMVIQEAVERVVFAHVLKLDD
jgi:hypothetical protein